MPNVKAYQTEEEIAQQELSEGTIDLKEYNKRLGDLQRDYREQAQEEAQETYNRAMEEY